MKKAATLRKLLYPMTQKLVKNAKLKLGPWTDDWSQEKFKEKLKEQGSDWRDIEVSDSYFLDSVVYRSPCDSCKHVFRKKERYIIWLTSKSNHSLLQIIVYHMGINHSSAQVGMPKCLLDKPYIL